MKKICTVCLCALFALAFGCDDDKKTGSFTLIFQHSVDGMILQQDQLIYSSPTVSASRSYSVELLQYYVSKIKLHKSGGSGVEILDLHYVDIDDSDTHEVLVGSVPSGSYTSISFTFGLDEETNVEDNLPATQENINMELPDVPIFGGGYHYMKMEGKFMDTLQAQSPYATHFVKHATEHRYFTQTITINTPLEVPEGELTLDVLVLDMDINKWYTPGAHDFQIVGPAIMMNAPVQNNLSSNGIAGLFSATVQQILTKQ